MKNALNLMTGYAYGAVSKGLVLGLLLTLTACALPKQTVRPVVYDFGPGSRGASLVPGLTTLTPLVLDEVVASPALDNTAVQYRLAYVDEQQLRPYKQARWSMMPSQLIRQRLREHLGQHRTLLDPGDHSVFDGSRRLAPAPPLTLRLELEEFSQLFESPDKSVGLLRLRATAIQTSATGEKRITQRHVVVQQPAPSADAPGGVRAMAAATDAAMREIDEWLQELAR